LTNKTKEIFIKVDTELSFWNDYRTSYLPDLAVITIKTKNNSPKKEITNATKLAQVFPSGLNKFSMAWL